MNTQHAVMQQAIDALCAMLNSFVMDTSPLRTIGQQNAAASARDGISALRQAIAEPAVVGMTAQELHNEIMNLPCVTGMLTHSERIAYKIGHRDACHAAAELVITKGASQ